LLIASTKKSVRPNTYRTRRNLLPGLTCAFFFCAGLALAPNLGIEDDEALFASAIYRPRAELYQIHIGRSHIPLMLMSYLGALKSLIYKPIFLAFGTGVWALRVPMLLAGTFSVWLFFLLLRRIAGERAAWIGCALLAVDSSYLITVVFDWGPVALQHLFMIGGSLLLVRFYQQREDWALAAGFLLFGLVLWDKALAVWMLSGMGLAAILTLRRQIFDTLTVRRALIAVLAFSLGVLPLAIYNVQNQWGTFHGNLTRDTQGIAAKALFLLNTESKGMFGWLTSPNWQTPQPHLPQGLLQRASAGISALAGEPHNFILAWAFGLALLLAPFAGRNALRAITFSVIAMTVAWIQMAINASTGGSVHHTILLWPLPQIIIATSLAAASRRFGRAGMTAIAAVVAVVVASGALVINQYYVETLRFGGAQSWSDGIFALSNYVKDLPAKNFVSLDWGIMEPLRLLHKGRLPLLNGSDPVARPEMTEEDRKGANWLLSEPGNVFITHTKPYEFFPGNSDRLVAFAAQSGLRQQPLATISDRHNRQVYEVFKFVK
jgi:4-amino-4-deoxy-L-arabinose transferase-like glycosyltransferase